MTSITLLRVLPASTARVVHSLGHGPDTRLWKIFSFSPLISTTDHTEHTQQGRIRLLEALFFSKPLISQSIKKISSFKNLFSAHKIPGRN